MKHVLLLLFALFSVYADDTLSYTVESYTADGKPCMSDCIDGSCKADSGAYKKDCVPGNKTAYQYYTALYESDKPLCLSRCGQFGEDYDWCYVSEDFLEWDYCSSIVNKEKVTHQFTKSKGPCKNECAKRGYDYYWCDTYWDSWDYCYPDFMDTYIQSYTIKGEKCIGHCTKQEGTSYNWCRASSGWDYCAVPAKPLLALNCHTEKCSGGSPGGGGRRRRADDLDRLNDECVRRPGVVREYARALEHWPGLVTTHVSAPGNSVTSYTASQPRSADEPLLPRAVHAHVSPQNVPPRASRPGDSIPSHVRRNLELMGMLRNDPENNNDEAGHLIGWQNAGPSEPYNFAPQPRRLNRGTRTGDVISPSIWLTDEGHINEWVRAGGSVYQVVVVLYEDPHLPTRPSAFGTSAIFYRADGTTDHTCPDYFFSNSPRSEM